MGYLRFSDVDLALLKRFGAQYEVNKSGDPGADWKLFIARDLLRVRDFRGKPTVFAQGKGDLALDAVVDGLHWWLHSQHFGAGSPKLRVAVRVASASSGEIVPEHTRVALAAMAAWTSIELVGFTLDNRDLNFSQLGPYPDPASDPRVSGEWLAALTTRPVLPAELLALERQVKTTVPSFRWYRSVTETKWSGRIAGWEVCTASAKTLNITWKSPAAGHCPAPTFAGFQSEIADLAQQRLSKGKDEHLIESALLRGRVPIPVTSDVLVQMVPVGEPPFQFPALYAKGGQARYIDAMMRHVDGLFILELKVPSGSEGQYYRHAIAQAFLYRRFIKAATHLHGWIAAHGAGASGNSIAAVVFPKIESPQRHKLFDPLKKTAGRFGVCVRELDQTIAQLRVLAMT